MPEANPTKKCGKCKNTKPVSEFYRDAKNKDGLRYTCKACKRAYERSEAGKASQAKYAKTDNGKASRSKANAKYIKTEAGKISKSKSSAKYTKTDAGKLSQSRRNAKYSIVNKIKSKTQNALNRAIKPGKITKPSICEECQSTSRIEGHHDDYSFPLVVRWLCQSCHIAWHKDNGPGLNG